MGVRVAVHGCGHGDLDAIYTELKLREDVGGKIDLLLINGDFEACRNDGDLQQLATPQKYRHLTDFSKYYSGEKQAPVLTLFIGGNHEATNHLWELYHGGWVAPNIYYLGHAGVVNFAGLRIAGISGIFQQKDAMKGYFEVFPLKKSQLKSPYHTREFEVWRLSHLTGRLDIMMSHDWPKGVYHEGNKHIVVKQKPYVHDVCPTTVGNPHLSSLLSTLQPALWTAAHMHCRLDEFVKHQNNSETHFLALGKYAPYLDNSKYFEVIDFPEASGKRVLTYDREWLAVVRKTQPQIPRDSVSRQRSYFEMKPNIPSSEQQWVQKNVVETERLVIPRNFVQTVPAHPQNRVLTKMEVNPQTLQFLDLLSLDCSTDPCVSVNRPRNETKSQKKAPCYVASGIPSVELYQTQKRAPKVTLDNEFPPLK